MLQVSRDGSKIKITLDPGMSDRQVMLTYWNCTYDWYAELLARQINTTMAARLRAIREEAYAAGWRDAKAKKPRQDWQSSGW